MRRKANKRRRAPRRNNRKGLNLEARSYPGQTVCTLRVTSGPVVLTTTATTGLISFVQQMDPQTDISNWNNRFASLFSEFRIKKVEVQLVTISNTTGQAVCWWDEAASTLTTPPTFTEATERGLRYIPISVNSSRSIHKYVWVPRDIKDLIFYSTNTTTFASPVGFKLFTNNTNYGSSVTPTQAFNMTLHFTLEFRGYS
jgi:hypothetical protein